MKSVDFFKIIKDSAVILISAFLFAISVYSFILPNSFTNGGVSGVVAMISYIINTDRFAGYINLAINVPLIIISFIGLSRKFAIRTTAHIVLVSVFLAVLPLADKGRMLQYVTGGDVGKSILASLGGGAIAGVSLAFVLSVNGSTGGVDIIGAFLQRRNPALSVQWGIFTVNALIVGLSAFVYSYNVEEKTYSFSIASLEPIMLALIFQFVSARICDVITHGAKTALKFEVITDHPDELARDIIENLKRGVTVLPAKGMFEGKERNLLVCVVKKRQIQRFKDILKKYPDAFSYVAQVNEIIGIFNTGR